ncbi:MAG: hypothetical protein JNL83_21215 [Myxococcales bacterium]|nr:hypothetical protein [Myxococcales bacterium]
MTRPRLLLVAGCALAALAHLRWGVGALAWLAPIPLIHYLRETTGWRSRVLFATALTLAWVAATAKIVSAPLPPAFALLGVAFGLIQVAPYLAFDALRRRLGDRIGVVLFPALVATAELLQVRFTELANWGATGNTQVDNLPLLQVASLAGVAGVGFVVNLVAAAGELAWARRTFRPLAIAVTIAFVAHGFGAARLAQTDTGMVRVAAVNTIATFGPEANLDAAQRAQIVDTLLADTAEAARAGAKLVVWTEASLLAELDEERPVIDRIRATAAAHRIHVVAGYVLPGSPLFQNKLVWVRPDGRVDHEYWKHHPAPGEPSVVGTEALTAVEDPELGRMGAALCYDYDFAQLAAEHGDLGIDLIALPSSDWRGIDPIHTQMAAVRAIEQGFSIVRSTRFGLSSGIDPHGRLRAWSSSFDGGSRVTIVDLPRHRVWTLYGAIGDLFGWLCAAGSVAALVSVFARARARRVDRSGGRWHRAG